MPRAIPTEPEILDYFQRYSNWGLWGPNDELGTVNFVTSEKRRRAVSLAREGVSVSCSRPVQKGAAPDVRTTPIHLMTGSGEAYAGGAKSMPGVDQMSGDFIGLAFHGFTITHVDSLAHIFWDGKMYNGYPAETVTVRDGATKNAIDSLADGVASRGVLLDIPFLNGVKWLQPGTPVFPEDLDAAEKECGVRVESGDILLVRTGWYRKRLDEGPTSPSARPGLQGCCIPWLHQRQVAMLGSDGTNDVAPSHYPLVRMPIHQVGIVAMGLWLIDNCNLEGLAAACQKNRRWEFLLTIAPLRITNGTGSPVNPIAVF